MPPECFLAVSSALVEVMCTYQIACILSVALTRLRLCWTNVCSIRGSCERHCHCATIVAATSRPLWTSEQTDSIAMVDDVAGGQVRCQRYVLLFGGGAGLHKVNLTLGIGCQRPPHGLEVLVGRNDTKETCDILQEAFEGDLTHMIVTKLRVCFGSKGPEVLPVILFPEATDEA